MDETNKGTVKGFSTMLTIDDIAKILNISTSQAYRLIHSDKSFPSMRVGKAIRVPPHAFSVWLDEQIQKPSN